MYSTLLHASLVLVPILGVSWALGFFVVGGGVYATVVEWIFFFFTTLQGVAIFFAHCVLNREVGVGGGRWEVGGGGERWEVGGGRWG